MQRAPDLDSDLKQRRELEEKIWRGLGDDPIQRKGDQLQKDLEDILVPYLKMDAAIIPINVRWRNIIAKLKK